jgi:hypothetical protein
MYNPQILPCNTEEAPDPDKRRKWHASNDPEIELNMNVVAPLASFATKCTERQVFAYTLSLILLR